MKNQINPAEQDDKIRRTQARLAQIDLRYAALISDVCTTLCEIERTAECYREVALDALKGTADHER